MDAPLCVCQPSWRRRSIRGPPAMLRPRGIHVSNSRGGGKRGIQRVSRGHQHPGPESRQQPVRIGSCNGRWQRVRQRKVELPQQQGRPQQRQAGQHRLQQMREEHGGEHGREGGGVGYRNGGEQLVRLRDEQRRGRAGWVAATAKGGMAAARSRSRRGSWPRTRRSSKMCLISPWTVV